MGSKDTILQDWACNTDQVHHDTSNLVWLIHRSMSQWFLTQYLLTLGQNPLHFSFPPEIDEDSLMTGAEQLSQAILESGLQPSSFSEYALTVTPRL